MTPRRAYALAVDAAADITYIVWELALGPIWDRLNGYDFDAYKTALEQDRIARSYEGE